MITILDKSKCCGCSACASACPKQCISMTVDYEGFLYPQVDENHCIHCSLCEKVCPVINQSTKSLPLAVYAAKNLDDEIRKNSSSGGIFHLLAENVLNKGGFVFGAEFDKDWGVHHVCIDSLRNLYRLRGSKYTQSLIGTSYQDVKHLLNQGQIVLFSGTPCQVSGLKKYLGKEYSNLLTIDIVCHGVPSPKIWKDYLDTVLLGIREQLDENETSIIKDISFRNKAFGWRGYYFNIDIDVLDEKNVVKRHLKVSHPASKNVYMQGFLKDMYLRPSCYDCPARSGKSGSDITLGDFWGIEKYHPEIDDNRGISLVLVRTEKGRTFYKNLRLEDISSKYEFGITINKCLETSPLFPKYRNEFWERYPIQGFDVVLQICDSLKPTLYRRIKNKVKSIFK